MAKLIFSFIFLPLVLVLAQNNTPGRIACEIQKNNNSKMNFPRSDANETIYPFIYNLKDSFNEAFKNILSQQIVYSNEDLIILFVAAEDSKGNLGVYRVEINNALKILKTQLINRLPIKLKELKETYNLRVPFNLFSFNKGLLLFPSNEIGVWKLLNLSTGTMLHQWTHPVGFINPQIKESYVSWTHIEPEKTQLFVYDLKSDSTKIFKSKETIHFLNVHKNNLYYLDITRVDTVNSFIRVLSYINGSIKVVLELSTSTADYDNFLMVSNFLFFTSQKLLSTKSPTSVLEAQVNVFDFNKNTVVQKIKYSNFLVALLKKYGTQQPKLLSHPLWNQNELIFTLNNLGGLIKFNYAAKQWYYIGYPYEGNTCFNPSFVNITQ